MMLVLFDTRENYIQALQKHTISDVFVHNIFNTSWCF